MIGGQVPKLETEDDTSDEGTVSEVNVSEEISEFEENAENSIRLDTSVSELFSWSSEVCVEAIIADSEDCGKTTGTDMLDTSEYTDDENVDSEADMEVSVTSEVDVQLGSIDSGDAELSSSVELDEEELSSVNKSLSAIDVGISWSDGAAVKLFSTVEIGRRIVDAYESREDDASSTVLSSGPRDEVIVLEAMIDDPYPALVELSKVMIGCDNVDVGENETSAKTSCVFEVIVGPDG